MGEKLECWECSSSLQCCGNLWPKARYPSMTAVEAGKTVAELEGSESKVVLFSVMGMTCAACAGSVEKTIKRLPGIREAVVDVLNHKAQVLYLPSMVNVSINLSPYTLFQRFHHCLLCFSHFNYFFRLFNTFASLHTRILSSLKNHKSLYTQHNDTIKEY